MSRYQRARPLLSLVACGILVVIWIMALVPRRADADGTTVGDRVWLDTDGDGFQDDKETGVGGVLVRLHRLSPPTSTRTFTTTFTGAYWFEDVADGVYYQLEFIAPGFDFTAPDMPPPPPPPARQQDLYDSDVDPATGRTVAFRLTDDDQYKWDAGLVVLQLYRRRT